ncbi:hypothetical protein V495_08648 [Pseudogymnoascus sp. VKM F-4514 (FW-929)]|nr:hypothetical protein V495_08648 [Pseudogymnoascus sp. VKM F-4514 (FW-929)]KFY64927.1 hypothetical protein V497_01553 [Pseudogymnoascus sp. VKM F-4516 (FW-969)]
MPTIGVDKAELFKALGREYTTEEFEELCFEFGIELDEDTTDSPRPIVNGKEEAPQLKIEIPANRYDMLCFEGIALMLQIFLGKFPLPNYRLVTPSSGELQTLTVSKETAEVRPYVSAAILRNVTFTQASYDSFIALQDKLHANLARNRTLASIGTHDLDTLQGPFTYEALPPKDISFIPLNQTKKLNGEELMQFYENDKHLGKFLHIIRDKPVYPVVYDSKRTVCSLPPIINGEHSKITLKSRNVFIECTATDKTKVEIVNNIVVSMFSQYCSEPFTIEPVKVISEHNGETRVTPDLAYRKFEAEVDYINNCCGLSETPERLCELLTKMCYKATPSSTDKNILDVSIPQTRADVLHQCDIMEDVAVAYGFNRLPRNNPNKAATIAKPLPINKLGDIVRLESAMAGWTEVMPLILCARDENFSWLNRKDNGTAITLANPKTAEYQIVRTSLLPGLLKTIRENKKHALPLKVFEVSDVAFKDETLERKARNERHFAAAWYGKTSGFEMIHGLLDRVLLMLKQDFLIAADVTSKSLDYKVSENPTKQNGYWIEEINEETFFAGHAAAIWLRIDGKEARVGEFGILHPTVLDKFELKYPVSTLEINLEVFL